MVSPGTQASSEKIRDTRGNAILLIHNMENDYIHPEGHFARIGADVWSLEPFKSTISDVIKTARDGGMELIFVKEGYPFDNTMDHSPVSHGTIDPNLENASISSGRLTNGILEACMPTETDQTFHSTIPKSIGFLLLEYLRSKRPSHVFNIGICLEGFSFPGEGFRTFAVDGCLKFFSPSTAKFNDFIPSDSFDSLSSRNDIFPSGSHESTPTPAPAPAPVDYNSGTLASNHSQDFDFDRLSSFHRNTQSFHSVNGNSNQGNSSHVLSQAANALSLFQRARDNDEDSVGSQTSLAASHWLTSAVSSGDWEAVAGVEDRFLDLSELYLGPRFAAGASGRLYKGVYRGQDVAVKILRPPSGEDDRQKLNSEFQQEVFLLNSVSHPNIVRFVGACRKDDSCCMATEFLSGGTLKKFLRSDTAPIPIISVFDMALDLASAMEFLHSRGIIHRDLKSENMVFDGSRTLKLTDFGIARVTATSGEMTCEMGTYRWMAPEVINHMPYNEKADVYSFGIVLWEIITREQPFGNLTPVQTAFAVATKNARPEIPGTTLSVLGDLIEMCWHSDDKKRPPFSEVVEILKKGKRDYIFDPLAMPNFEPSKRFSYQKEADQKFEEVKEHQPHCCTIL